MRTHVALVETLMPAPQTGRQGRLERSFLFVGPYSAPRLRQASTGPSAVSLVVRVRRREPKGRVAKWPAQDWYSTPVGYRFVKATFKEPVGWAARIRRGGAQTVA